MSYSVIKDYTNKQGKTHQAHFSPKGKYLGPVSIKGDKPFLLTKVKPVQEPLRQLKTFYFDTGVWNNIIGFVDIKPFKKDTFVNGTYSVRVPFMSTLIETVVIIGRTPMFAKCIVNKSVWENGYVSKKVELKKKIFIQDGVECIKMEYVTITAHDNERYMFSTKEEWVSFHNPRGSAPPSDDESDSDSEDESDSSVSTRPSSDEESESD